METLRSIAFNLPASNNFSWTADRDVVIRHIQSGGTNLVVHRRSTNTNAGLLALQQVFSDDTVIAWFNGTAPVFLSDVNSLVRSGQTIYVSNGAVTAQCVLFVADFVESPV